MLCKVIEPINDTLVFQGLLYIFVIYLIWLISLEIAAQIFKLTDESIILIFLVLCNLLESCFSFSKFFNALFKSFSPLFDYFLTPLSILLNIFFTFNYLIYIFLLLGQFLLFYFILLFHLLKSDLIIIVLSKSFLLLMNSVGL